MEKSYYGKTKTGEDVYKYILKNEYLEICILNYGGIITEILMPDKFGNIDNIVLGFNTLKEYEDKSPYFGCITGRNAGRISKGLFSINRKKFSLAINNGENHIHGGIMGLDKKVWDGKLENNQLILTYFSKDGEEGYPGNVYFKVIYTLKENEFTIQYEATTDMETIINLTNHTYFNLTGDLSKEILSQELYIDSDYFSELDGTSIPTGKFIKVDNTPFDFRKPKFIGKDIDANYEQLISAKGYDHPFILNKNKRVEIVVKEYSTGRAVEVETDQKVVVLYTGNYLSPPRCGFCLETQNLPNYINTPNWEHTIYSDEIPYKAKTTYRFKIER